MNFTSFLGRWKKLPPKWRRRFLWCVSLIAVYVLFGFLVAPSIIKSQLIKRLPEITKRHAAVREVRFNPLALSLTIRGLALTEPDGKRFAGWEEFYLNFQTSSLFRWAWTFREIRLVDPYGEVQLLKNGQLNFANMFEKTEPEPVKPAAAPNAGVPRIQVFLLSITNGSVGIEDQTRRTTFRTDYRPINIRLTDFTTRPGTKTPYSFKAENDTGKSIAWAGDITAQPFASKGNLEVRQADPKKYQPYLEDFTHAQIVAGKADARIDYAFSTSTNGIDLTVSNGTFRLVDFRVEDPDTKETVLAIPAVNVDDVSLDLRSKKARFGAIRVSDLNVFARINKDRSMNLLSLLEPAPTNAPPASAKVFSAATNAPPAPWNVVVGEFHLENAGATFQDQSHNLPFETRLKPIQLSLTNLSTAANTEAQYQFAITTEASETVAGSGHVSINPVCSSGAVKISGVDLKKYWPFAESQIRGGILAGKLNLGGDYAAALAGTNLSLILSNGSINLANFQLKDAITNETPFALGNFNIEQISANLAEKKVTIGRAATAGTKIIVRRQGDGTINLLNLLAPAQRRAGEGSPSNASQERTTSEMEKSASYPWSVVLQEFDLQQWQVRWEDLTLPAPALLQADDIALNVKGLSTDTTQPIELAVGLKLNNAGTISVRGTAQAEPPKASLEVGVEGLDLPPFQPYANPHVRLTINRGALNVHGHATYQTAETNLPNATFQGDVSVTNLLATDQIQLEEFIKWTGLNLEGIDFAWHPDQVKVAAIRVDGLKTALLIDTNKQPNLLAILPATTNAAPARTPETGKPKPAMQAATPPAASMPISVGLLALTNISFRFGDASIQPNCRFDLQELNGTVKGLSSDSAATADVDISGRIDEHSPFALFGKVNPLANKMTLDLTFSNANMELPSFTPYLEKFAGHPLNKGRLSTALHYSIQQNELKAQNHFRIDQFTLGARNDSPDATKLPVKLAIALLKDRNGRIELDVPVTGRLDDPEFRVAPIIWKVVLNLITKAATSPFKLLGALVGGGEELSFVDFEPGTATMLGGETNKIAKLTKALVERPAINLEIDSSVDAHGDRHALARLAVEKRLKDARRAEVAATTQAPASAETFEIDQATCERLLRAEFVKAYGTNWAEPLAALQAAAQTNLGMASISGHTNRPAVGTTKPKSKIAIALQVVKSWNPFERKNSPTGAARRQGIADARLLRENPALGTLTPDLMEHLLAVKTEVAPEAFITLMKARTVAVQQELLRSGEIQADRTFIVAPKPIGPGFQGQARASLSLN